MTRRKGRRDSNTNSTRRVSADSDEDIDDNVVEILPFLPNTPKTATIAVTRRMMLTCQAGRLHCVETVCPKAKTEASNATVMYSISFYPWKMEPHCYYSHPEAAANWHSHLHADDITVGCVDISCVRTALTTERIYRCRHGAKPTSTYKDGAPQRTCRACASTLRNMAGQDDPRVKRFTIAVSSAHRRKPTAPISSRSVVEVEVERPSPWLRRTGMALTDSEMEDEEFFIESTKALQLDQRPRGTTHHFPLRLSVTRAEELDEVFECTNMFSVESSSGSE
ncbi:hypothetical protein GQ600_8295 [Phytophthora cactorum]|nr:hypothetical protein GQ600_8295 [Phytophthora cactorum]